MAEENETEAGPEAFAPDADSTVGTFGERGTSALPDDHEWKRGLTVERSRDGLGAEKFTDEQAKASNMTHTAHDDSK